MSNDPQPESLPHDLGILVKQHGLPPRPLKILVVDDEDDFREMLCVLLQQLGVETVAARHGHEALSLIDLVHPDAVFLDHRMPGLTGAQVARSMRATGHRAPVVLITGDQSRDAIAESAGTRLSLAKPITLDDLRDMVLAVARDSEQ